MRILAVIVLAAAALGFGAATSVIRNSPPDNKLMFTIGAMFVPMLLLIVGMVLWERGAPPPKRQA